jgi:glycogen(starch) synthase
LNICFVSQEYPPETAWGGIGTYVCEMARSLTERGHSVIVLSKAVDKESCAFENGIHTYRIRNKWNLSKGRFFWRFQKFIDGYRYKVGEELSKLTNKHHIDVIESSDIYADLFYYMLVRGQGPAIVLKLHTPRWLVDKTAQTQPKAWNRFEYFAENFCIKRADMAYSCSHALLRAGKEFFPKREYMVVHNLISLPLSLPAKEDDGKTVLFAGRLEWRKGVQVFGRVVPQVVNRINNVRFLFLGPDCGWHGGNSLKEFILDQIPAKMKESLIFTGGVPRQEILNHLRKAAVCVLPSLWENFPYTCLEAMACGCAVVGSKNGGMAEMIEDRVSGILIDPERPEEISGAILMLLNDKKLRRKLGENATARVREHFSPNRIVDQTLDVYHRAIEIHERKRIS